MHPLADRSRMCIPRGATLGMVILACCSPPGAPRGATRPVVTTDPSTTALVSGAPASARPDALARPDREALTERLCGERRPCRLLRVHQAGRDGRGRSLAVGLIHLGTQSARGPDEHAASEEKLDPAGWRKEGSSDVFEPSGMLCQRYEYGLVAFEDTRIIGAWRLVEICNAGHGAAGIGEDRVTVDANRFEHQRAGGSAWRWSETTTVQLSPLEVLSEDSSGGWTLGPNHDRRSWDRSRFAGTTTWGSPDCNAPAAEDAPKHTSWLLPQVALSAAFTERGWHATPLGRCSLRAAGGEAGKLLSGGRADRADAALSAVVDEAHRLYVEIHDDRFMPTSAAVQDTLELWLTISRSSYMDHCIDPSALDMQATALTMAGGRRARVAAKPAQLATEWSAPEPRVRRVRFTLPHEVQALTLIYRDSDDGRQVERIIATSDFDPNDARSLGRLQRIGKDVVRCAIVNGQLEPEAVRSVAPDELLLR